MASAHSQPPPEVLVRLGLVVVLAAQGRAQISLFPPSTRVSSSQGLSHRLSASELPRRPLALVLEPSFVQAQFLHLPVGHALVWAALSAFLRLLVKEAPRPALLPNQGDLANLVAQLPLVVLL